MRIQLAAAAFTAVAALLSPSPASALCDVNYSGPADGLWQTPGNWDGNAVPTSGQQACIPVGKGTILVGDTVFATARNLTAASGVHVGNGGTLTLADTTSTGFTQSFANLAVDVGGTLSTAGSKISIAGTAVVNGTISAAVQLDSGSLSGTGTIGSTFSNLAGTVYPGGDGTVGTLHFGSGINQQDDGTIVIDLASDGSFDQLDGPNFNHFLFGHIVVQLLGGYAPQVGTSWAFLVPDGPGSQVTVQTTPASFSAHAIPFGGELSLDSPLPSSTTTSTTLTGTTTTTLASCGDGALDAGEACDQAAFGDDVVCDGAADQSCRRCTTGCTLSCALCNAATVDSFILPKVAVVKLNSRDAAKSKLVAAGVFDTGGAPSDLAAAATLSVGGVDLQVAAPERAGGGFLLKSPGFLFRVIPAKTGSSKGKFRMKWVRDLTGLIDPDAPLTMRFSNPTIDGTGTVRLSGGRYRLRRKPGDLIAPTLYLALVRAKLQGAGKDTLVMQLGFATDGPAPASAPDLTVSFGPTYVVTIPGAGFTRNGNRFTGSAGGATAILDYQRELVTIRAKKVTLGTFTDGAQAVLAAAQLGSDSRANAVRMVKKGKGLRY